MWIPRPLYLLLPWFYLISGLIIFSQHDHVWLMKCLGVIVIGHACMIWIHRFLWANSDQDKY